MNIGFIGCGGIAHKMAQTIIDLNHNEITLYAVAARDMKRAEEFRKKYMAKVAYGSYEELVNDKNVDLIYVATPHSHHYEHMKLALEHGKHVLCEKAFTVNAKEAKSIIELAQNKKLLLCEAIWTRFMPSRQIINELIATNIIGNVTSLSANLGYSIKNVARLVDPNLAGGALLDVGVYPLNFALMAFGNDFKKIVANALIGPEQVDYTDNIVIYYSDKVCHLQATMLAVTDRSGYIYGEKGYIYVENINNPSKVIVYDNSYNVIKEIKMPKSVSGYEYQLLECLDAFKNGQIETKSMPLSETLFVMEQLDEIREQIGLKYPFE